MAKKSYIPEVKQDIPWLTLEESMAENMKRVNKDCDRAIWEYYYGSPCRVKSDYNP